jgi:hypothetical protein
VRVVSVEFQADRDRSGDLHSNTYDDGDSVEHDIARQHGQR